MGRARELEERLLLCQTELQQRTEELRKCQERLTLLSQAAVGPLDAMMAFLEPGRAGPPAECE